MNDQKRHLFQILEPRLDASWNSCEEDITSPSNPLRKIGAPDQEADSQLEAI
jgi:hypothetical protein